jgi:signal transduction histidine kinase
MMFRSLWFRLIGILAIVILVALVVVGLTASILTVRQLDMIGTRNGEFWAVQVAPVLAEQYVKDGDWRSAQEVLSDPYIASAPGNRGYDTGPMVGPHMGNREEMWRRMDIHLVLVDQDGMAVADTDNEFRGSKFPANLIAEGIPIVIDNELAGVLLVVPENFQSTVTIRQTYFPSVARGIVFAAAAAGLVALVLGTVLFRRITHPLSELESAARTVAGGHLAARVSVRSKDEIGMVASAFNSMTEQLERQHQLRKQMVADVAHELRTPLSVMQGTLEAMMDGVLKPNKTELNNLHDQTRRLTRLVEDLRILSLAEEGQLRLELTRVDISELVEKAVQSMSGIAKERAVSLSVQMSGDRHVINGDGDRILEVFANLLDNALRYTPEKGSVIIRVYSAGGQVVVQVVDSGSGIPADELPYIFERFWRGDKSRSRNSGGSGIGLAIVRQIVGLHQGTIEVESEPGKGTTFTVRFPGIPENQP